MAVPQSNLQSSAWRLLQLSALTAVNVSFVLGMRYEWYASIGTRAPDPQHSVFVKGAEVVGYVTPDQAFWTFTMPMWLLYGGIAALVAFAKFGPKGWPKLDLAGLLYSGIIAVLVVSGVVLFTIDIFAGSHAVAFFETGKWALPCRSDAATTYRCSIADPGLRNAVIIFVAFLACGIGMQLWRPSGRRAASEVADDDLYLD